MKMESVSKKGCYYAAKLALLSIYVKALISHFRFTTENVIASQHDMSDMEILSLFAHFFCVEISTFGIKTKFLHHDFIPHKCSKFAS